MKIATINTTIKILTTKALNVAGKCTVNEDCVDEYPICNNGNCGKYFTSVILWKNIAIMFESYCMHFQCVASSNTAYF